MVTGKMKYIVECFFSFLYEKYKVKKKIHLSMNKRKNRRSLAQIRLFWKMKDTYIHKTTSQNTKTEAMYALCGVQLIWSQKYFFSKGFGKSNQTQSGLAWFRQIIREEEESSLVTHLFVRLQHQNTNASIAKQSWLTTCMSYKRQ